MVALTILGTSVACAEATSPQERDDEGSQDAGSAAYPTGDADAGSSSSASSTEVADSASFHTERSSDGATSASTSALPAVASSSSDSTELSSPDTRAPGGGSSTETGPEPEIPTSSPLGTRNFACDRSPSPMFESQGVLEMHLIADFSVINGNDKETATSPGSLDPDGSGPLAPVAVEVHARGISRFRECGFRPFKVKFAEKQKDNVFRKLGKSVKFVTHCGDRDGMHPTLQAGSLDEYYERVRMEHLAYQLLTPLETMSLATRLVRLTYEDTKTGSKETHLAFVREPEDELAQRCGMVEGEDIPDVPTTLNERANLLLYLLNNFVIQADVKNRFDVVDVEKQLRAPVPYDFDLLGIFRRDYLGLDGRTLAQNAEAFADWLRRNQSPALHEEAALILSKGEAMQELIDSAELTAENRELFAEWLSSFLGVLKEFDDCGPFEADPSFVRCHVPDDHTAAVEAATLTPLGEHVLLLEPPGDVDVLGVDLDSNRLYTLTTGLQTTLRSPEGSLVGTLGAGSSADTNSSAAVALSLRPDASGRYTVEFDRGDTLVCSDMWNNDPQALGQPFAVYEDDHGGDVTSATLLQADSTTSGAFELSTLQGLYDEDWFRVLITSDTALFLESAGMNSATLEVYNAAAPDLALQSYYFESPDARQDLTELFPEPGEYILRLVQGWDRASYVLDVSTRSD